MKRYLLPVFIVLVIATVVFPQHVSASRVIAIDSDSSSAAALYDDGSVVAWGMSNGCFNSDTPIPINISGVKSISVSGMNLYFLKNDGTVWAMGDNTYGQLGIGTNNSFYGLVFPAVQNITRVDLLNNITAISGKGHVLALSDDGTVWAWGNNMNGAIGNGNATIPYNIPGFCEPYPVQVMGLSSITGIYAGDGTSFALASNGTLWAWGRNDCGQLGDGTNNDSAIPIKVPITNVKTILEEARETLAIKNDGTAWTWGADLNPKPIFAKVGEQGGGGVIYHPEQIPELSDIDEICTLTFMLKNDGTVWVWGNNNNGAFGNGQLTNKYSSSPMMVPGLKNITEIATYLDMNREGWYRIALSDDGTVYRWGAGVATPTVFIQGDNTIMNPTQPTYNPTITTTSQSSGNNNEEYNPLAIVGMIGILVVVIVVLLIYKIRKG